MEAANQFVDIIKDMISQEIGKINQTTLCQVCSKIDSVHYDLLLVSDLKTVIKNVINMTRFDLEVGDYCYINKIDNKINNSYICYVQNPRFGVESIQNKNSTFITGGQSGGSEPEPTPVVLKGTMYTPFNLRLQPSGKQVGFEDASGEYAPSKTKETKTIYWKNYLRSDGGGQNTCIPGYPLLEDSSSICNCNGYAQGRYAEIYNEICGRSTRHISGGYGGTPRDIIKDSTRSIHSVYLAHPELYVTDFTNNDPKPGALLIYQIQGTSSYHSAIVEEVVEVDSNKRPTKIIVSRSAYNRNCYIGWSYAEKKNNWAYNNYSLCAIFYNPAIKSYSVSQDQYSTISYITNVSTATQLQLSDIAFGGSTKDCSISVKFSVSELGHRYLLLGNYNGSTGSQLNLEITVENKLRLYCQSGSSSPLIDKTGSTIIEANKVYTARIERFYRSGSGYQYNFYFLTDTDIESSTISSNLSFENLCPFADYRTGSTPFSGGLKIYWITQTTLESSTSYKYADVTTALYVPQKNKFQNTYGLLNLTSNTFYTNSSITGA